MRITSTLRPFVLCGTLLLPLAFPLSLAAQGTAADFARAEGLRDRFKGLVVGVVDQSGRIDSTSQLWYRRSTTADNEFMLMDAETEQKRAAFDHARISTALGQLLHRHIDPAVLLFNTIAFVDHERALAVTADSVRWQCTLVDYVCTKAPIRADGSRGGGGGSGGRSTFS